MISTTPITTAESSTTKIDKLLKDIVKGKDLKSFSRKQLSDLLDQLNCLGAIGLDTNGKQTSSPTLSRTSSPTSPQVSHYQI